MPTGSGWFLYQALILEWQNGGINRWYDFQEMLEAVRKINLRYLDIKKNVLWCEVHSYGGNKWGTKVLINHDTTAYYGSVPSSACPYL